MFPGSQAHDSYMQQVTVKKVNVTLNNIKSIEILEKMKYIEMRMIVHNSNDNILVEHTNIGLFFIQHELLFLVIQNNHSSFSSAFSVLVQETLSEHRKLNQYFFHTASYFHLVPEPFSCQLAS